MNKKLFELLEHLYSKYNKKDFDSDPIDFPHKFKYKNDIEVAAFISSLFAFGNVSSMKSVLAKLFNELGNSPYDIIINYDKNKLKKIGSKFYYRFYSGDDISVLLLVLNSILNRKKNLEQLFLDGYSNECENIKNSLHQFLDNFRTEIRNQKLNCSHGLKYMFTSPGAGSACKRMNLFLRWMVRKDTVDFGIWKGIRTDQLIIPVDTHIARISKKLKLTNRKSVNWKMAEEITKSLKRFDSNDPVKYDFALCHIGINKENFFTCIIFPLVVTVQQIYIF